MNKIYFTLPEAARYLFPYKGGRGNVQALRRLVKAKQVKVVYKGDQELISRDTLISLGVYFEKKK